MSYFDQDLPSSDSESDADYVPDTTIDLVSSDDESPALFAENETKPKAGKKEEEKECEEIQTSMDQKKKADDIFKMFLAEVAEDEKKAKSSICCGSASSSTSYENAGSSIAVSPQVDDDKSSQFSKDISRKASVDKPENKLPENQLCKLFDFAGETVAISSDGTILPGKEAAAAGCLENVPVKPEVKKRGLEAVLGKIQNKNPKLSVLDKTSLDWKNFKKSEAIEDELASFRKSKQGFIERQRFLERSDFRAYEIERDMRLSKKKKK